MSDNILITGAGTGFGLLTVQTMLDGGYTLYAGIRDPEGRNVERSAKVRVIIMPGSFTKGTSHFENHVAPAYEVTVAAYARLKPDFDQHGPGLENLYEGGEQPTPAVANEVARVLALPRGRKPLRTEVDSSKWGAGITRFLGGIWLTFLTATALGAGPASAQDKVCANEGANSPLERHKAWVLEGWERHAGDAPFDFAKKMDRFYDLVDTRGVFYDNLSPNGAPIFDSSIEYGRNWEASVNSSRTILHALTGRNEQLVGEKVASTTLGFVGDITRLTGEHIFFDARSQLGWTCTGGEWVIRHELNYAWNVSPAAVAPFFARKAK